MKWYTMQQYYERIISGIHGRENLQMAALLQSSSTIKKHLLLNNTNIHI